LVVMPALLTSSAMLSILDVNGRVVARQAVPAGSTDIIIDSISALWSGTYLVQVVTENGVMSAPLMLVR
jgi:hypothetical protein